VTAGRVLFGLRPSPFSLSRLLGSSRLSAGSVRKAPRTPLLSLASSSEYDRRRLPHLQAGTASSPRVSTPPAHGGTGGLLARGSQTPIRSPLSVSHALRGLLPPEPWWAYPIPLALLGFHHKSPPASRPLAGWTGSKAASPVAESPKAPGSGPSDLQAPKSRPVRRKAAPDLNHTSRSAPRAKPSGPARGRESRGGHNSSFAAGRPKRPASRQALLRPTGVRKRTSEGRGQDRAPDSEAPKGSALPDEPPTAVLPCHLPLRPPTSNLQKQAPASRCR
jgi:hypothetical protein